MASDDRTVDIGGGRGANRPARGRGARRAVPPPELPRGTTVGRYLIVSKIGEGGLGIVYAAYDPELDRKVALKLLRAEAANSARATVGRTRMLREAQAIAKLSHPHVVTVYDVGMYENQVFVAMEFVGAGTLLDWLRAQPRSWREVLALFLRAGEGLAAAHAAGLVHRDFKPANVLIGSDGRPRVADFGLARQATEPSAWTQGEEEWEDSELQTVRKALHSPVTVEGGVVGTPAYMAPEQHLALPTDARTDQFSFCVALYEALYGELPFVGKTTEELRLRVAQGKLAEPPKGRGVPAWLRRVISRGLSADPRERFPSMRELLAALRRDPEKLRRRIVQAAAVIAVVGVAIFASVRLLDPERRFCRGAESKLTGIWDPSRQRVIRRAFLATGKPFAPASWAGTKRTLDDFARAWVTMHTEACRATRIRGEQSEALLDLRMQCLRHRLGELRSLTDLLAKPDAALVQRAVQAAHGLSSLHGCANAEELRTGVPLPPDAPTRARIEKMRTRLGLTRALLAAGRYRAGFQLANQEVTDARHIGYPPVIAEALCLRGELAARSGKTTLAVRSLVEAGRTADTARLDRVRARAWVDLVFLVGRRQAKHAEGQRWGRRAAAVIARLRDTATLRASLLRNLGLVLEAEGRYREAKDRHERALALLEKVYGPEHPEVASALDNLGTVLTRMGEYGRAVEYHRRALSLRRKLLGAQHPDLATSHHNLGNALFRQGRSAEALRHYRRALAIKEAALGPWHLSVASSANNLGNALAARGRSRAGLAYLRRALAIREKVLGREHPAVARTCNDLGTVLYELGRLRAASASFERALRVREKALGREHAAVAETLNNLGEVRVKLGRFAAALPLYRRALAILEKSLGKKHPFVAYPLTGIGIAHLGLGAPAAAIAPLERALAIREAHPGDPSEIAETRFALARALWTTKSDRARARSLARQARGSYLQAGVARRQELAQVKAWLGRH